MTKLDLQKEIALLKDDLLLANSNLRAAERRNRELEKEMQQFVARQSTCPYVVSSDEGTQYCRLNGTLESVIEEIEKEIG